MDVETLTQSILARSSNLAELKALAKHLKSSSSLLKDAVDELPGALEELDFTTHTLGALYIFVAYGQARKDNVSQDDVTNVTNFVLAADKEQLELAPEACAGLVKVLSRMGKVHGGKAVIRPLMELARKLPGVVNEAHPELMLACIRSACYAVGFKSWLATPVDELEPGASQLRPRELLQYLYYAGVVCIGCKEYGEALDAFTLLFSVPYVLASLLEHGKVVPLPKYVPDMVARHLRAFGEAYDALAAAFAGGEPEALDAALVEHGPALVDDGNWGLAKLARHALTQRRIHDLTATYVTVSLESIAASVGLASPDDALVHVLAMIRRGQIHASVNEATGMVQFHADPETFDDARTMRKLHETIAACADLTRKVRNLDTDLYLDPQYIYKAELAHKTRGAGELEDHFAATIGASIEREESTPGSSSSRHAPY
ncbi:COP9 signalosome complex subunit 3 [Thecamonas trahens ATCC 50062]|uniref:COP9 signalosome complex subunit 3 n=1 Tax=Thecamonas trahens ATCC 50062 TaxID=461836 RepID=A0A0L0DR73_THETB|nr:COP9 signalosome complex subunit 3 [Thecamonas trahens ATCC 50062]KNC54814.1 COP9 signalosome complex subunit 3 [Thecamonas trahens ATCC 50062]|eukprot:XP_013761713.1 COP9 signalosome complex subunit 3 [Thecamonas trahens ATCC 50062]